jgi:S1-C subfamily serine protease
MKNMPTSTQLTIDKSNAINHQPIRSVYLIMCSKTFSKGTGFLLSNGVIITNAHVVQGCSASEITALSPSGEQLKFTSCVSDKEKYLAALTPENKLDDGLLIDADESVCVGDVVNTWGFPLGYNGPAPLLSVGYLSGFITYKTKDGLKKHLVVNGAFNQGNSGGPVFKSGDNKVIGVVVAKHAPFTAFQIDALQALKNNRSGMQYAATDSSGKTVRFAESQLVADLLYHYRNLAQVMIGEAIAPPVLQAFLDENSIGV